MMIASFIAFITLFGVAISKVANAEADLTEVLPNETVRLTFEAGQYRVFTDQIGDPELIIAGDYGNVPLTATGSITRQFRGRTWTSARSFLIDSPASYRVTNDGSLPLAVGLDAPPVEASNANFGLSFVVGTILGVPGFILVVAVALMRKSSRSRLRLATGTYSGVPYTPNPTQYGGQPPANYGGQPPANYGGPPPGAYGTPPPGAYGTPPPGPQGSPPPGTRPPNDPPPTNWPQR